MKVILAIFSALIIPQVILGDLVSDLQRNGLTTLLDLIQKAGIAGQLREPLTLFAPTNEAIDNLPPDVKRALNDVELLRKVLLFHVIPGANIPSSALKADNVVTTAEGSPLRVNVYEKGHGRMRYMTVTANGVKVISKDISAGDRSIVHVIDGVLPYPPPEDDIPTLLTKRGNFQTLLAAVKAANLVGALSDGSAKLTVFAPNDEAFRKIPQATLNSLLEPQNRGDLTAILTRHVLPLVLYSNGICWNTFPTLNENSMIKTKLYTNGVAVKQKRGSAQAKVVKADLAATNGVIHEIDTVI